jgi:hypothetical protein
VNLDPAGTQQAVFTSTMHADESGYSRDAFVAKYNAGGDLIWGNHIAGNGNIYNVTCALTHEGNVVTAGHFIENCKLNASVELTNTSTVNSIYLAMYESASLLDNVYSPEFEKVNIYTDDTNLYIKNVDNVRKIAVYDIQGALMLKSDLKEKINIESLSKGIYLVKVSSDKNSHTVKISR